MRPRTIIPVVATARITPGKVTQRVASVSPPRPRNKTGASRPKPTGALTRICVSLSVPDLAAIDSRALALGMERSCFLATAGLAACSADRAELEIAAWRTRGKVRP
jgi:hypothetical protein